MSQAESIPLRVQVIDMQSVTLDIVVPTYLPARDLTQRVARDAGLNAFWPDGRRRRYWIRARGRVVGDDERLADVGVIAGELVHLLPEPAGPEVVEQPPAYPETRDYPAGGNLALIGSVTSVLAWSVGWGVALSASDNLAVLLLPGVGLGLLACSLARHIFAGSGVRWTIAAVGVVVTLILLAPAAMIPYVSGLPLEQALNQLVPGGLAALLGVFIGWLAWWGPVEALPTRAESAPVATDHGATEMPCAICGQSARMDQLMGCQYQCGRYFHQGCYRARAALAHGDPSKCSICGVQVR
jgi:uncharacterized ubiquitin-like protein YukD